MVVELDDQEKIEVWIHCAKMFHVVCFIRKEWNFFEVSGPTFFCRRYNPEVRTWESLDTNGVEMFSVYVAPVLA